MEQSNTVTGLGVRLVLVLGARPNIDAMVRQSGAEPQYAAGQRVTDARTMQAAMQAAGAARMQVEGRLSKVQLDLKGQALYKVKWVVMIRVSHSQA